MKNKNIIRFVQSLIILPFVTGSSMPIGDLINNSIDQTIQVVFSQKNTTEAGKFLSLKESAKKKAEDRKMKAEAVDAYFKKYDMPLFGTGMKMVEEAEKNGLDWRLVAAISVRESTGGKFACRKATYNSFGWGSCSIGFESNDHAIETVARNIGGNHPKTAKYYAGKTVTEILQAYNPPSIAPRYAPQVISIMNAIGPEEFSDSTILVLAS